MLKINYEIKTKGDKGDEYVPAAERIKAIRASGSYSTKFLEENLIEVATYCKEQKHVNGWFAKVVVTIKYLLGFHVMKEKHDGSAFQEIDGSDFGTPSSALASAQTLAISKALGHAGIGVEDFVTDYEGMKGQKPVSTEKEINKLTNKIEGIKSNTISTAEVQITNIPVEKYPDLADMSPEEIWNTLTFSENIGHFFKDEKLNIKRKSREAGSGLLEGYNEGGVEGFIAAAKKQRYHTKFPGSLIAKAITGVDQDKKDDQELNDEKEITRIDPTQVGEIVKETPPEPTGKILLVLSADSMPGSAKIDDKRVDCFVFVSKSPDAHKITKDYFINIGINKVLYPCRVVGIKESPDEHYFYAVPEDDKIKPENNIFKSGIVLDATRAVGKKVDVKKIQSEIDKKAEEAKSLFTKKEVVIDETLPESHDQKGFDNLQKLKEILKGKSDEEMFLIVKELHPGYQSLGDFVRACSADDLDTIANFF